MFLFVWFSFFSWVLFQRFDYFFLFFKRRIFFYFIFLFGCMITVMYRIRLIFVSYLQMFKYSVYGISTEYRNFFLPVIFLFLKCLFLGGALYWFFLFETLFFLSYFDLFMGILIIIMGWLTFLFIRFFYAIFYVFSSILFLRWKASGGFSVFFVSLKHGFYERTWMELSGGQGVFSLLFKINHLLRVFSKIRVRILLYSVLFFTFYIF